ncbi:MAG TPA: type II CAAX endopeptidase family protein [Bryobacteraceae bacterium]|nr:type II CAAX endopeptidase family protein [Bryobacteraceae bacterium]
MEPLDPPVAVVSAPSAQAGILPANLLFLISLVLGLTLGSAAQAWRIWPGLILTELFLILLPALLFARATGSLAPALRLKWVGVRPCGMGLVIGAGLLPPAVLAGWLGQKILGYSITVPDSFLPTGIGGTLVYVLASAVSAPFCEEMLFRGYILAAWERIGCRPRTAILAVAALFTAYHVSPLRAPTVAVLALALTYVAWRTGSVWPSIAVHMGANGTVALLVVAGHGAALDNPSSRMALLAGIPAVAAAAFCLWRIAAVSPGPRDREPVPVSTQKSQWWPLAVAGVIVLLAGAGEFVINRFPQLRWAHEVRVEAPWTAPVTCSYEIYAAGAHIGDAEYRITPGSDSVLLYATVTFRARNDLTGAPMDLRFHAAWDRTSMVLRRFNGAVTRDGRPEAFQSIEDDSPSSRPSFAGGLYNPYELPWRLSAAVMLQSRKPRRPAYVDLWEAPLKSVSSSSKRSIRIQSDPETGSPRTIRIAIGYHASAWYDVEEPHILVRYRESGTEWILVTRQ